MRVEHKPELIQGSPQTFYRRLARQRVVSMTVAHCACQLPLRGVTDVSAFRSVIVKGQVQDTQAQEVLGPLQRLGALSEGPRQRLKKGARANDRSRKPVDLCSGAEQRFLVSHKSLIVERISYNSLPTFGCPLRSQENKFNSTIMSQPK